MATAKKGQLKDLIHDPNNANQHSQYGMGLLENSIRFNGLGRGIVISNDDVIIAGNGVVETAGQIGLEKLVIVETDGDEIVAIKRKDIQSGTKEFYNMALADNIVAKHNIVLSADVVEAIVEEIPETKFWGAIVLDENKKQEANEDDFEIADEIETDIVLGDLFEIGEHRLLCGDATNRVDVDKLFDDSKPILMVTDPPYGVKYDPNWRNKHNRTKGFKAETKQTGIVENDNITDWRNAYSLFPGDVSYVWHAGRHAKTVHQNLEDCSFEVLYQIIWNKMYGVFGRGDYHFQHEPCWYAIRKGAKHNWQGSRTETTVWDIKGFNPNGNDLGKREEKTGHGTQKPIECMARPIRNNSAQGEQVYDPFCGSGTTMVAAHQLKRQCFAIELSPQYCQIILDRMKKLDPSLVIKKNGQII